jgi:hypothetical protein
MDLGGRGWIQQQGRQICPFLPPINYHLKQKGINPSSTQNEYSLFWEPWKEDGEEAAENPDINFLRSVTETQWGECMLARCKVCMKQS